MKHTFLIAFCLVSISTFAQKLTKVNPVIKSATTGIYDLPYAVERPDPKLVYNIVIEVQRASEKPDTINWALNNVARLLNLHSAGGVPAKNMHVVLAIHGGATFITMSNEAYREKYKVDNPNLQLFKELDEAGVKMFVCGQSMIARGVDKDKMVPQTKIALSMLTTLTTYQTKGYALLQF